ncbi:ABC transporter substrate-binding protein [Cytobacillus sp. FJAT-54145]|uniref:ABC transporter substrate-binding protein n=1 Tax=Cytobacillus spartinae TaxID=3299023 RepID=A0ABW6KA20_9BACI
MESQYAKLVSVKGPRIVAGSFNRFKRDVDFNNRKLRLAINLAVDREEIVNRGYHGYAHQLPAMTPPWAFDYPDDLSPRPYDPNQARKLLKEAGWPNKRPLQIATTKEFKKIANLIAPQIQKALGISVNVTVIPQEEEVKWKRVIAEKKLVPAFDIFLATENALFYEGTPAFFHREFFGENGALRIGPEIPEFNEWFKKMAAETDLTKLKEVAKDIDRYVYHEALGLFLCSPDELYAVNRHVKFRPYRTTFELADTEVSKEHWSIKLNNKF